MSAYSNVTLQISKTVTVYLKNKIDTAFWLCTAIPLYAFISDHHSIEKPKLTYPCHSKKIEGPHVLPIFKQIEHHLLGHDPTS